MPRIPMTPENKAARPSDYPKLTLSKNEKARVICIEPEPMVEYVHTLRAVRIEGGKPVVERVNKWGRDIEETQFDFVGRSLCHGDFDVLVKKGSDADACPVCRAALDSDAVQPPERRYGMHVLKYHTTGDGFRLASPFQVELLLWLFTERRWGQIVDFNEEWKDSGGLQQHDLLLGPCENALYQKYDMAVAQKAEWLESPDRKKLVLETYKNNQAADVSAIIARRASADQVQSDLNRVLDQYALAYGGGPVVSPTLDDDDLGGGLDEFAPKASEAVEDSPEAGSADETKSKSKPSLGGTIDLADILS